ncbi:hypothetical protein [Nocardia sp. NPDC024068]|uniref:hypothetical protein n=1 Tax=Nocardia sp. NPDC024068 TaxID=3157197 RepID=UPI0033F8BC36
MAPEQASPHWDRIVGDDWPQIPPSAWHALETAAREGAEALNLSDVAQARRAFDEAVRRSEGLERIRLAMVALENRPRAFAAALSAAADTFGTFGEVVRRTRNQILDVVDDASDRIEQVGRENNAEDDGESDDSEEAAADRRAVEAILTEARDDVRDIVAAAVNSMGPQGLPRLDDIAEALGQPGPWRSGSVPDAGPSKRRRSYAPGDKSHHHWDPRRRGDKHPRWGPGFGELVPPDSPLGRKLIDLIDDILHPAPGMPGPVLPPPGVGAEIPVGADDPVGAGPPAGENLPANGGQAPTGSDPGYSAGGPPAGQRPDAGARGGGAEVSDGGSAADDSADGSAVGSEPAGDPVDRAAADRSAGTETAAAETPDQKAEPARTDGPGRDDMSGILAHDTTREPGSASGVPAVPLVPPALPGGAPAAAPGSAISTAAAATGNAGAPASGAPAPGSPGNSASAVSTTQVAKGTPGVVEAHRAPGATGKVALPGTGASVPAATVGKIPGSFPEGAPDANKPEGAGTVQEALGIAMLSSAAPAFVVGERVDGDLVLARTVLGGIRAATDSWVVGVDWAVAVLRHSSGVSAFVTSNEGRGWLPARLYLPTEISLPWLWSVAEEAGWEGIADPARILVEFAAAWGSKSGSKLAALASSKPIDPVLGRQLGAVGLAGSVGPSDTMDLRTPGHGARDRLGLTAADGLLDRTAAVPDNMVALRCLELAVDAHIRVARAELPAVDAMGAPEIRLRLLRALRDGRDFAASWWEEMQDADDLIAATALGHRADTSRIALGDLRAGADEPEPDSDLSVLRSLTFQRRCNELVLLLAEHRDRQTLRDAVYAHAQILTHPVFTRQTEAPPPPARGTVSAGPTR